MGIGGNRSLYVSDARRQRTATAPAGRSVWLVIALVALILAGQVLPTADTWFE